MTSEIAETLLKVDVKPAKAVAYFVEELALPVSTARRIYTLHLLADIGPGAADAVPRIEPLLRDRDNTLRIEAAHALGAIGPAAETSIPLLTRMVDNRNADVREASTEALIRIAHDGKGLGPALLSAIYNGNSACAARLAAALRTTGAEPRLLRRLDALAGDDPDPAVRASARRAVEFLSPAPRPTTRPSAL